MNSAYIRNIEGVQYYCSVKKSALYHYNVEICNTHYIAILDTASLNPYVASFLIPVLFIYIVLIFSYFSS